jgi:formate hydrogenlyase subunit 4
LAENSRIPFDDPNTHLELTMIHEVMVLDHSGPALGMILYGAALKFFVFAALIVRLALPFATGSAWLDWTTFTSGMLAVAVVVGVVESSMARLRMTHVPILLVAACLLSAFGIILLLR